MPTEVRYPPLAFLNRIHWMGEYTIREDTPPDRSGRLLRPVGPMTSNVFLGGDELAFIGTLLAIWLLQVLVISINCFRSGCALVK